MHSIPYGRQHITSDDVDAVISALQSDFLTQGPAIEKFETAFAEYVGSRHAVAVSNGTAALHLSTLALDVKSGQKVITTPITFAASANCVRYCGGEVVFGDIDPDTYLLDVDAVRRLLEKATKGEYVGIIPVDFAGRAINLEAFRKLADEYGLWLIEDACHSPGGYFVNDAGERQFCGNGNYADISVFSFHPVKHIACGEGGMITTNDEKLYNKLRMLRTHGITREQGAFVNDNALAGGLEDEYPGWYMEMQELGYNYRLTDIQAALGVSQLKRAEGGLERRRKIARRYTEAFSDNTWLFGQSSAIEGHAYHLYVVEVEDRLGLYNHLRAHKIFAQVHYIPVHLMPYYQGMGWKKGDLPNAERYYRQCLSIPMYPSMTDEEQEYVISSIKAYYSA